MSVLGAVFIVGGVVGCVIPAIPGPLLAFAALLLVAVPGGWALIPAWLLVVLGLGAVATTVLDNVLPVLSSKRAGAGKAGIWGSIVGMVVGSFFTPIGTIVGAFVGALLGEVLFNRENRQPLKAALGVFRGTMLGILLKLAVAGTIAYFFVVSVVRLFG